MASKTIVGRLRKKALSLQVKYNLLAVGIGLAYSERKDQFRGRPRKGRPPHWTKLAIKALVPRKLPLSPKEALPRNVILRIGKKLFQFPVDVVQVGNRWPCPKTGQLHSGTATSSLSGAGPLPGRRMVVKICQGNIEIPASNSSRPASCRYPVGTIGWIGQNSKGAPYIITSAHVVGKVYPPNVSTRLIPEPQVALSFNNKITDYRLPDADVPFVLPPTIKSSSGRIVDVAALRLPFIPNFNKRIRVPSLVDLYKFLGAPAFIRVERNQEIIGLPGVIEEILEPSTQEIDYVPTPLPRSVVMRFRDDRTTEKGDSGAPVLVRRNQDLFLLGFHFFESEKIEGQPDFKTVSFSVPAGHAFSFLKLHPLSPSV